MCLKFVDWERVKVAFTTQYRHLCGWCRSRTDGTKTLQSDLWFFSWVCGIPLSCPFPLTLYHRIPSFNNPETESFWKKCGKRRKCWSPAFSPFFTMFSTISNEENIILFTWNLSSANAFNFVETKIMSFGKELTLYHTIPTFNNPEKEAFRIHWGERRKCW